MLEKCFYKELLKVSLYSQALSIDFNQHRVGLKVKAWLKCSFRKLWCNLWTTALAMFWAGHKKVQLETCARHFWRKLVQFQISLIEQPFHEAVNQLLRPISLILTKLFKYSWFSITHTQNNTFKWWCISLYLIHSSFHCANIWCSVQDTYYVGGHKMCSKVVWKLICPNTAILFLACKL